jgi:hypothetical protein
VQHHVPHATTPSTHSPIDFLPSFHMRIPLGIMKDISSITMAGAADVYLINQLAHVMISSQPTHTHPLSRAAHTLNARRIIMATSSCSRVVIINIFARVGPSCSHMSSSCSHIPSSHMFTSCHHHLIIMLLHSTAPNHSHCKNWVTPPPPQICKLQHVHQLARCASSLDSQRVLARKDNWI